MTKPGRTGIILCCAGGLFLLAVGLLSYRLHASQVRIGELEGELARMRQREAQAAVDRSVSHQMEQIAYGQQALSEERSREAIRQSEIAQAATLRAEADRSHAVKAQASAEVFAKEAFESFQMAERQRREAELQRREAVDARNTADTLNYISLGRTLGTQSYAIYQAGDHEIGNMLAYAAYLYTSDYGGDLYTPAVFQALAQSAEGHSYWNVHQSSIPRIATHTADGALLTASTYGELSSHRMQGEHLVSHRLMYDKTCCFRDLLTVKGGKSYAVSHTGSLAIIDGERVRRIVLEGIASPYSLQDMGDGRNILIVGKQDIALFDIASDMIVDVRHLDYHVASTGNSGNKPILFDSGGRMHLVSSIDDISDEPIPVAGSVTAFACSENGQLTAYGMSDGTIWLIDRNGARHKLVGHLSQVTKINVSHGRLYSSSYDGKLLCWLISTGQIKPVTLFQSHSWLMDFDFDDKQENVWASEANGTISRYLISLPLIRQRLQANVSRNFTQQEWDYYVGKGIPYRKLKVKNDE